MTVLLNVCGINKEFGDIEVLKDINFDIVLEDRIGLVGLNGAGKSTLANIIYGNLTPDKGNLLWYKKDIEIGYLKQDSIYEQRTWNGDNIKFKNHGDIKNFFEISSYLGMKKIDPMEEQRVKNLSGGEKMKLAFTRIWANNPDFLILDEPTNHIDYQGLQWLIEELKRYKGTVLIISHDRYFLDSTANKVIEINNGLGDTYYGNYSFYREEKRRRYESQLHQYEIQESNKIKIEEEIKRLKAWSNKAHKESRKKQSAGLGKKEYFRMKAKKRDKQIKSKIKMLEKLKTDGIKKPEEDKKINFSFHEATLKGTRIIEAVDIKKGFDSRVLFKESSFYIMRGEKIGIFGSNGCGKTTLLKILLGKEFLDKGEIFISKAITIGYLSQETLDIDKAQSVIEVFGILLREEEGRIRTLLANMGFNEEMITQPLSTLSEGEITRVRMARIIAKSYDLLVLDEPLNHLDIYSREKLEEALKDYEGTMILVSHDRYMIESLCDGLLVFEDNKLKKIIGDPKQYLESLSHGNYNSKAKHEKENGSKYSEKKIKEEKMLIENEIAYVLGELSKLSQNTPEYNNMDQKFKDLINKKKALESLL